MVFSYGCVEKWYEEVSGGEEVKIVKNRLNFFTKTRISRESVPLNQHPSFVKFNLYFGYLEISIYFKTSFSKIEFILSNLKFCADFEFKVKSGVIK